MTQQSIHPERPRTMYAEQIKWQDKQPSSFSATYYAPRPHYPFVMSLGRVFPTTRAQAQQFIKSDAYFDVLNNVDVERIEALMNKYGFKGTYQYTKSKRWVRMCNQWQFCECLKKEYNL